MSGIRNREDPVFRVFYHIKNRREKIGTDENGRFHGDSGIERIRFRGFLLYFNYGYLTQHLTSCINRTNLIGKCDVFDFSNVPVCICLQEQEK